VDRARGKRRGISPAAAARHLQAARVNMDFHKQHPFPFKTHVSTRFNQIEPAQHEFLFQQFGLSRVHQNIFFKIGLRRDNSNFCPKIGLRRLNTILIPLEKTNFVKFGGIRPGDLSYHRPLS